MDRRQQMAAAAERYRAMARERRELKRRQKAEGSRVVDTPERVRARAARLAQAGRLQPEALVKAIVPGEPLEPHVLLERIIDATNDLQAVNFLTKGGRAARTVARISFDRRGRLVPAGTGSLVGTRLLLTNNHVLPDVAAAQQAVAEFNCELDLDEVTGPIVAYRLDPAVLFVTDEHLDYTLVAVQAGPDGRTPGQEFGWNRLIAQQGKIAMGEPVNVVGHPMGRLKEIAVRNNSLQTVLEEFLHYETDTEPGNSGSPVFNDQWEIVALHHSGVPRTDEDGNWLKRDGSRWRPQDGDDAIDWVANEGARVSVLLRQLADRPLSDGERAVLAELGAQALPTEARAAGEAPVDGSPVQPAPTRPERLVGAGRTGLVARRAPLDGATQLVFLHGRGQQGKDPQLLRGKWAAGLAKGLALAGLPAVDAADVWFPFYGDAFADALGAREALMVDPLGAELDPAEAFAPRDASTQAVYAALLEEAAERAGLPPEAAGVEEGLLGGVVGRLQTPLSWLANRSGLDEVLIAAVFRDVAAYLDREEIRQVVLDSVLQDVPASGRVVLVSHSLGTVVAMDLLTRLPEQVEVVQLVTAGSPLGMDTVFKRLLAGGPQRPERVASWLNAWCPADAVAIGCPLRDDWGDHLTEVITSNPKDRAHSIEEYLADGRVAAAIGASLR